MKVEELTQVNICCLVLEDLLNEIDWPVFKSKETIEKSIEIKALLVNAKKRCDKLLEIHENGLRQHATTSEADAQQVGSEAE